LNKCFISSVFDPISIQTISSVTPWRIMDNLPLITSMIQLCNEEDECHMLNVRYESVCCSWDENGKWL